MTALRPEESLDSMYSPRFSSSKNFFENSIVKRVLRLQSAHHQNVRLRHGNVARSTTKCLYLFDRALGQSIKIEQIRFFDQGELFSGLERYDRAV